MSATGKGEAREEVPRPFVKYAGGKRRLLPVLRAKVGTFGRYHETAGRYHELCVGGGALFFELRREGLLGGGAVLNDSNARLVRTYTALRDVSSAVMRHLRFHEEMHAREGEAHFRKVRKCAIDAEEDWTVAAWLIYLNKTAYNGLYRVNRKGDFNVSFGDYAEPKILDEENLRACARALRGVELRCGDFAVETGVEPGDLVYFDPPYVPTSKSASFTGYTAGGFAEADQRRLAARARELKERGARVVLTNSDHPLVRELYPEPFWNVERVEVRGDALNTDGAKRGKVGELVVS